MFVINIVKHWICFPHCHPTLYITLFLFISPCLILIQHQMTYLFPHTSVVSNFMQTISYLQIFTSKRPKFVEKCPSQPVIKPLRCRRNFIIDLRLMHFCIIHYPSIYGKSLKGTKHLTFQYNRSYNLDR